jgi:beta-glucosidase
MMQVLFKRWTPVFGIVSAMAIGLFSCKTKPGDTVNSLLKKESKVLVTVEDYTFRDLNKNGKLDVYEDSREPVENRINDLLKQMNIQEKAGLMFINGTVINDDGSIDKKPGAKGPAAMLPSSKELITAQKMNHFNYWTTPSISAMATGYNAIQQVAESTRLGIPVTIASDPRHAFNETIFAMSAGGFSQWPEPLGLAAIGDAGLMKKFANIARQEYLAVGIRESLHPQVDLATEPRWPRIAGTFGEDANLAAKMVAAYISGFQGDKLDSNSVACMTKHFPGGGPQNKGLDPHFPFQKGQLYPGNNFNYHLIPFEAAFKAHTAAIMPYYGVPMDAGHEHVGFSYNKAIITGLLRNKYHFDRVVCTDWGLVSDTHMGPVNWPARAWGVEKLTIPERVQRIIDAGVDQFGGENIPEVIVQLVKENMVSEARINQSVKRLLRQKFELGLFDNPYIDAVQAPKIVGKPEFMKAGAAAQRQAMTLLKNDNKTLPLQSGKLKIYVQNINVKEAAKYGTVVTNPKEANFAIVRLKTPWYPVQTDIPMAKSFHHGDLDFKGTKKDSILQLLNSVPTIVVLNLDRPAVIPEINAKAKGLLADFGASDAAVLDVIFGKAKPGGKLPFELPSSMEAVRNQKEDVPHDSKDPLYKFGFGLKY